MISKIFSTDKFDNKTAVNDGINTYSFGDLKNLIASEIKFLEDKKNNVVITSKDNFSFIIQFFASVFCNKNIYLITDKTRLNNIDFDYDILEGYEKESIKNYEFKNTDFTKPIINFYTSGSSGRPKIIKKSLYNLICEAQDISDKFDFNNQKSAVISTTTMCHLFGLTFHLMVPLCNGLIINTQNISYPENVDKENTILVSTPTFLSSVPKFNIPFKIYPTYIITAGSKLNENVFKYLEKKSKIIEIYGSTETGVIAYKTHFNDDFRLFDNVNVKTKENSIEIQSEYFYEDKITINDNVELNNRSLKIKNRTDRLLKIYEKRINAEELENNLKINDFVKDCYIAKHEGKLVCLCALSDLGQKYLLGNNVANLIKNLKKHLLNSSGIIPRKWKFIDEIPMTKSGKINKDLINHLFNINLSLPIILDKELSPNMIIYKILFYNQCNFLKGHFTKFKIVPGVLQLYLAKEFANIYFNLSLGKGQWKRIKFSNIITPDSIVYLKLEKKEKQMNFEFYSGTKKYASGVFLCENVFKEVI